MSTEAVLIVDDEEFVVQAIKRTLSLEGYTTIGTVDAEEAIRIMRDTPPAVLISDQRMPRMTGVELMQQARHFSPSTVRLLISGYSDIDVVISAINEGQIFQYISKPWQEAELLKKVKESFQFRQDNLEKEGLLSQSLSEQEQWRTLLDKSDAKVKQTVDNTVKTLIKIIQVKDEELLQHSLRVSSCAVQVASRMQLSVQRLQNLEYAGTFHDIGKIAIRDQILYKAGSLDESEFSVMMEHPVYGADILRELGFLDEVAEIILQHHEKFDGSGYPRKLKGEEILLEARILAVADVYDALMSKRVYHEELAAEQVLAILSQESGSHFDPNVVEHFSKLKLNPVEMIAKAGDR